MYKYRDNQKEMMTMEDKNPLLHDRGGVDYKLEKWADKILRDARKNRKKKKGKHPTGKAGSQRGPRPSWR